jgi:ABC-2 type transport system ATP-binding protein
MSEMENTADHLVVVGRGRLIAAESLTAFAARGSGTGVTVRSADPEALTAVLRAHGADVVAADSGALSVAGLDATGVGELAAEHRIVLLELSGHAAGLEETFMELTADSLDYVAGRKETSR